MKRLSPDLEQRLMHAVERMPAFPKSVQRILEMTRRLDCLPKDLVGVIEKDPVMTMKILRIINSAYYGLPQRITSVAQAVVYLGINTIKNLAISFAAIGILPRFNTCGFDIQRYLLHSLSVALLARHLCEVYARGEADHTDCYIAGLLHDFGKVVFAQSLAQPFMQALEIASEKGAPLHVAERQTIGVDHARVGALLAQKWQFAEPLVACIRDHHEAAVVTPMLDCLRAADIVCRRMDFGDAGNPWREEQAEELPGRFGDLPTLLAELGDVDRFHRDAQQFAQIGAER